MWLIVNRDELKEYFEGMSRLVRGTEGPKAEEERERACPVEPEIRRVLLRYLHQSVEIGSDAGNIAGILQEVGADYVQLLEAGGTRVLIRFAQIFLVHTV